MRVWKRTTAILAAVCILAAMTPPAVFASENAATKSLSGVLLPENTDSDNEVFAGTVWEKEPDSLLGASSSDYVTFTPDEFVNQIAAVCAMARAQKFKYDDSRTEIPCADQKISCDRMIARALYDFGYRDQRKGGMTVGTEESYLLTHGWEKITDPSTAQRGDVVLLYNAAGPAHTFVVASYDASTGLCSKYDLGSQSRINTVQPFTDVPLDEWTDKDIYCLFRAKQDPDLARQYPSTGDVADGDEIILTSALNGTSSAEVTGSSVENKANVQLYHTNFTDAQTFILKQNDDLSFRIVNKNSGLSLDIYGSDTKDGTNVQQFTANEENAQKWYFEKNDDGTYTIFNVSGQVLDIAGGKSADRTNIQIYHANGTKAQRWNVLKVVHDLSAGDSFEIVSSKNEDVTLDVVAGSLADKANIRVYSRNNTEAQKFSFIKDSDGNYEIVNAKSGKAVDVTAGSLFDRANIRQYHRNSSAAQKWKVLKNGDGSYFLVCAKSRRLLDIAGGQAVSRTNVWQYKFNASEAQEWILQ